ncbi:hypothetical protein [Pseudoalteromonas denitrificans]|uniref:Uncharacterized protein n=1 Tax=Pseudoalteromonas denitrificans DSM 6059 TaxID=1123010 RepID=A0A1I1U548_9GAMM|nr:hypothetical protein [Pseudoalteromonas denitrificans]SFD65814.1 hypothetical protein SAMN02745724_05115 [Pseudoalteromonas denitrificans DSM 6059]
MKINRFNKLILAGAISIAVSGVVNAQTTDLSMIKVTTIESKLLVNAIYTETNTDNSQQEVNMDYVEAALLSKVASLPTECNVESVFPSAETSSINPAAELVGNWEGFMDDEMYDDDMDSDDDDMDSDDDDMDSDDDDMDSDDDGDMDSDDDDMDSDDGDMDSDDDGDMDSDDDGDMYSDDEEEGDYQSYLTISASGYLVQSDYENKNDVGTCKVTFLGELVSDLYKKN